MIYFLFIIYFSINSFIIGAGELFVQEPTENKLRYISNLILFYFFGVFISIYYLIPEPKFIKHLNFWYQINFTDKFKGFNQAKVNKFEMIMGKKSTNDTSIAANQWERIKLRYNYKPTKSFRKV